MDLTKLQPATIGLRDAIGDLHKAVAENTKFATPPHRYLTFREYLVRTFGWLGTLSKIENRLEFQALAAANRGLFESAADCLFIHRDKSLAPIEAIDLWEESAAVKNGDILLEYYSRFPPLPPEFAAIAAELKSANAIRIRDERDKRWGRHPNRWTDLDLPSLARDLDKNRACQKTCQYIIPLEQLYVDHGTSLNHVVHGSAFAGMYIPAEQMDQHCATMLYHSWHLAGIVGLVADHEIFKREGPDSLIGKALTGASEVFRKFIE